MNQTTLDELRSNLALNLKSIRLAKGLAQERLALDAGVRDGRIKPGDLLVLEAMGGGFTWGAAAVRY